MLLASSHAVASTQSRDDVVGTDEAEDASARVDVLALEMHDGDPTFSVELTLASPYGGTSSVMYAVHFTMSGTNATVCWNPQAANLSVSAFGARVQIVREELDEDIFGCERFADRTIVGPTMREHHPWYRDQGVVHGENEDGTGFVRWPVNKEAFGGPGLLGVTDIVVETYSRGLSTGAVASGDPARFSWVRQDQAPEEGSWNHSFRGQPLAPPPPPPLPGQLTLQAPSLEGAAVRAGSTTSIPFGVSIDQGRTNVSFSVDTTGGVRALFDPPLLALDPSRPSAQTTLVLEVPEDARADLVLVARAASDTGLVATAELVLPVENPRPLAAQGPLEGEDVSTAGAGEGDDAGTIKTLDPRQRTPSASALLVLAAVGAAMVLARRVTRRSP